MIILLCYYNEQLCIIYIYYIIFIFIYIIYILYIYITFIYIISRTCEAVNMSITLPRVVSPFLYCTLKIKNNRILGDMFSPLHAYDIDCKNSRGLARRVTSAE